MPSICALAPAGSARLARDFVDHTRPAVRIANAKRDRPR
jgi:hypothetical protein